MKLVLAEKPSVAQSIAKVLYGHALSPVQYAPAKEPDPF